jgi:hypothetical protein
VKTEDWRELGQRAVETSLKRPKPPTLFALSASVERGAIGQPLAKRPAPWSTHEQFLFDVQLVVYRAAFNLCVKLPLVIDSVTDERFGAANDLLDKIGVPQLTKHEVLAKVFPAFELSGDALTWFSRNVLPEMLRQAADLLSLFTLPYEDAYPSTWFSGDMAKSRYLELPDQIEEGASEDDCTTRELAVALSEALIKGVISPTGQEVEGLDGLDEWMVGTGDDDDDMKPVLASEANITKVSEGDLTISTSDDEDLTVSVAAKLVSWVLTRLRSFCTKRKHGSVHFRSEEQEQRAALAAAARVRGVARRAAGGGRTAQLQAELAEAKEAACTMAKLLLAARSNGSEVASALTEAKTRAVHPKVCPPPIEMPAELPARINNITDAIVSPEAVEKASGIVEKYAAAQAPGM